MTKQAELEARLESSGRQAFEATWLTTQPERRQVARVFDFSAKHAPYINWESIAIEARQLGAHFEARYLQDGACTITMFWSYADGE